MNNVVLIGNLARDPEQRTTGNGTSVTSFTVAVSRKFKDAEGKYQSDFINCVAWRGTADFVAKYFAKGAKIALAGSIQTRSYDDKQGNKRYSTEVLADNVEFVTSKAHSPQRENDFQPVGEEQAKTANELFSEDSGNFEPLDDAELPF